MNFIQSNDVFKSDLDILDSLDSEVSRRFFVGFSEEKPTLEMALRAAGIKDHDIVLQDSRRYANTARKNPEITKLGLSDDEANAISCYTLQGNGGGKSPYEVINEGLVGSRNKAGLASTGRLLFLLLSGLRKLPRTRPSAGQIFYRGIRAKVPQTRGEATKMDGNGTIVTHQYYEEGKTVTWWGFTSTSTSLKAANNFIRDAAVKTLFHIGGEDLWGYDIKAFSEYPKEDEILLEPEAKVFVKEEPEDSGAFLMIEVTLQPFIHLVLEDIIPVGKASSVPTQIGQPPVTNAYSGGSFSEIQGKGTFYNQSEGNFAATLQMPTTSWSGGVPLPQNAFNIQKKKWDCAWKECPPYVNQMVRYSVDPCNPRVAAKMVAGDNCYCTIIGNAFVPFNTVASWSVKVLRSRENNGHSIYAGVAPSDINQNGYDYNTMCGWYLHCQNSTLWSGPPHNYRGMGYGAQMLGFGGCMNVGVVMDTIKGELSFVLNGANLGTAYERIPLNKPLVPCLLLWKYGDSVELDIPEATNEDSLIPVPSNLTIKNATHDSITLAWDEVVGATYKIEVDGSKFWYVTTANSFFKSGLLPDTEHSFRVCTVKGSSVSEWSDVVKGRTLKWGCVWKECPDYVVNVRKYIVDGKNPRVATKIKGNYPYTIIGNTYIPLSKVTSWNIKILKSGNNDGSDINIGVASLDINQNNVDYVKCEWYFNCYYSTLPSGLPYNYIGKEYGPRKGDGQYVHTGDSVGVVMDTTKGDLSFVLNRVNLGVAYEGIPLDKPLVPCVILRWHGDSIELDLSEVKENEVDSSIPVPFITKAKSTTWDSIALTWDEVADASFYQIEVDGNKFFYAPATNTFTKRGFLPESEHSFRARTVRGSSVGEWSGVVKGRTMKAPEFSECVWKKCPGDVDYDRKYSVDEGNPRVATKINSSGNYCTIIGNIPIPLSTVTSWNIKVRKSKYDGDRILIGVAPNDIKQNYDNDYDSCGWYFRCCSSSLSSGPPHNYWNKEYGPRKDYRQYVHTGDSVGVVIDTTRGDLSFVLNGVDLGAAYDGIPLDKPLVPCVLLYYEDDSVELII